MKKIIYFLVLEVLFLGFFGIILPAVFPIYNILLIELLECIHEALRNDMLDLALFLSTFVHEIIWIKTVYKGFILLFFFLIAWTFITKDDLRMIGNMNSSSKGWFLVMIGMSTMYAFGFAFFQSLSLAILSRIFTEQYWWVGSIGMISALIFGTAFFYIILFRNLYSQPGEKNISGILDA